MMIKLRLFARYREVIGIEHECLNLTATSVAELRQALIARGGDWQVLTDTKLCCALNEVLCREESLISDGDEVAFFPQMTGG